MAEEQAVALEEATTEGAAVEPAEVSEATENTEGQVEIPPAEGELEGKVEEKSPSQQRRERRKAEMSRLRDSEAAAREKLGEANAKLERIEKAAQSTQPPKETDFADYTEYQAALAAHKSMGMLDDRERTRIREDADQQQREIDNLATQRQREAQENWASQTAEAKTRYADFDEVALDQNVPVSPTMAQIISTSDVGADVAYHLGKHRAEAAEITQMSDLDAARALGRIEAQIATPAAQVKTTAPAPITPVKPKASGSKDPEKMSYGEYRAAREAGKI